MKGKKGNKPGRPGGSPDLLPCMIYIDLEGKWYHNGAEIIRKDLIELFFRNMSIDGEGRYVITWDGSRCLLDVEDTAYVVRSVTHVPARGPEPERIILGLSDGDREDLNPETLQVNSANIPYCQVKHGFPARLTRQAYYQLAEHVLESDGSFYLSLNGRRYPLSIPG